MIIMLIIISIMTIIIIIISIMMIIIMTIIINLFNTKLLQNDRFNILDSAPRRTWKGDRVLRSHFEKSHFKDFHFEV